MSAIKTTLLTVVILTLGVAATAQDLTHDWSFGFGDNEDQYGGLVAVDRQANVVMAGSFRGSMDLGGVVLTSEFSSDIFVAKYTPSGALIWARQFGMDLHDEACQALDVDDLGNIYVGGTFDFRLNLGGSSLVCDGTSWPDIYLAKFDPDGNHIWSKDFGDYQREGIYQLVTTGSGDIALAGTFEGTVDFGSGDLTCVGSRDAYIARFDSAGTHVWSDRWGISGYLYCHDVEFFSSGDIVAVFELKDSADFGDGVLTTRGSSDIVLVRYDLSGNHVWSHQFGDSLYDVSKSLAVDSTDYVVIAGWYSGTIEIGGTVFTAGASGDILIAKFHEGGDPLLVKSIRGGSQSYADDVVIDNDNNFIITGRYSGSINLGGGLITSYWGKDLYLAKFHQYGGHIWSEGFPGQYDELVKNLAVSPDDAVLMSGYFEGTVEFGGDTLFSPDGNDDWNGFLSRFRIRTEPKISSIVDIDPDQGRSVRLSFLGSANDLPGSSTPILQYEVYRKITPLPANVPVVEPGLPLALPSKSDMAALATGWDYIGAVPASGMDEYHTTVPTLADSTISEGMYWTTYFVRAATSDPLVYFDSAPDSGYSIDNIAPQMPLNVVVNYNTGVANAVFWDECPDADFEYHNVYRDVTSDFTCTPGNLIASTAEENWSDTGYDGPGVYYRITAVDFSGNESAPSGSGTPTGIADIPLRPALHQNTPNPFNPITTIHYDIPAGGAHVLIQVFDVGGRLVRTLADGFLPAGNRTVSWNGRDNIGDPVSSGVYFYRLTAGSYKETRKMVLLK
jgi:hypothetical protein